VNAGGKMLKAVELQLRFGVQQENGRRMLDLVAEQVPLVESKPSAA
jgi:hypothetical protein